MVKYLENNNSGFASFKANADASKPPLKFNGILWWVILFLLSWWLLSGWLSPKPVVKDVIAEPVAAVEIVNMPVQQIVDSAISAKSSGLRISDISLNHYQKEQAGQESVRLLSGAGEFAEIGLLANGTVAPTANTLWKTARIAGPNSVTWRNSDGVDFIRTITINEYTIQIHDEVKNNSNKDVAFAPYARIVRASGAESTGVSVGGIAMANNSIEKEDWRSLEKKSHAYENKSAGFVGFSDQYWETIASVSAPDQTIRIKKLDSGMFQSDISSAMVNVPANQTGSFDAYIFAGPKDAKILAASKIAGLTQTMDYGWFWFLARPFLWCLTALYSLVANYGLAIILLTIGLRILMWPLTRKSFTAMASMQKMQPELMQIQKLYANDKLRMQTEMTKLYQSHKASPMSGCLPMLLQIPIFFALYKALLIAVPLRHAGFLWISDLSVMDPYFILPILMGATMWWQQHLQSAASKAPAAPGDVAAQTQKMMKWLPLIFTALFAFMPAGLVLYWAVSNLFGIGQMLVIKRTNS